MATPQPRPGPGGPATSSASSSYTGIVVTTANPQVIPAPTSGSNSAHSNGNPDFPVAAIAVVSILSGLAAILVAYKTYVWWFRRYNRRNEVPLPETRPLANAKSPQMGSGPSLMSLAYFEGRRSASALDMYSSGPPTMRQREESWGGDSFGEKEGWSPNGSASVLHMGTATSRQSLASSAAGGAGGAKRSFYGAGAAVNGPQLRQQASSTRLNGAPHAPHSRIDIVPPLPLAPHPGTIIAMDRATLDFAPSSSVRPGEAGGSLGLGPAFEQVRASISADANREAGSRGEYDERSGSSASSSAGGSGGGSSDRYASSRGSPHRARMAATGAATQSSASTSSSSTSSPPLAMSRPMPPPINTQLAAASSQESGSGHGSAPASPLDKLQQRIAIEARRADAREAKARERTERVRRANQGDDGTWSQGSEQQC